MAALVQGYPQQSGTATMLQTRPSSASGMLQTVPVQSSAPYTSGTSQRNSIHGLPAAVTAPVVYRGGSAPVQPYAFTSTPNLNPTTQWQQTRAHRTSSSPAVPTSQSLDSQQNVARSRYSASVSMTNPPSTASAGPQVGAGHRDDFALPSSRRVTSAPRTPQANGAPLQPGSGQTVPVRVPPERYRRSALRSSDSQGGNSAPPTTSSGNGGNTRSGPDQKVARQLRPSQPSLSNRPSSFVGRVSGSAIDDMGLPRSQSQDEIKRVRRRSMPALDSAGFLTPPQLKRPEELIRPKSSDKDSKPAKTGNYLTVDKAGNDGRVGSSDSRSSGRSSRSSSSVNRNANSPDPTGNPTLPTSPPDQAGASQDYPRLVNIPPRSSSSDAASAKRTVNPSPLSKPVTMDTEGENGPTEAGDSATLEPEKPSTPRFESPALKQLSAINEKGGRARSKTSRLRRAFSFGSAAEFRKAVHESNAAESSPAKLHKDRNPEDAYDAEQARIAQQQEEAGIGSNIYAGGRLFSGSTDNLSISSTASSASIMIRKMGRGMKKSTRSLVGLFRPKSVIGATVTEGTQPESTQVAVSMITAEAERERVNVNPDPRAQGGGTGFPRLERNSIDAAKVPSSDSERLGSSGTDSTAARKSIVGGEKERAEVLAAVRKGILKNRSGSSSPSPRPSDKGPAFDLPSVPHATDSPSSSAPSTPNEESQGHRRPGTVAIGSEDYFVSALRLRQDTKSAPSTPQGSMKRNATFSPRIVFFETWPSQEYDRRGDIATCNRLTPMLAQQIKEELNSFKMEMEVHENSKIYTHFF
ncbi:Protein BNI4 [Madurella mycetomatis]|uniref:Protein BNI4 n=1 Tax=Madurella mycetomatis TaxID=100816 RepID=A0A175VZX3_9PEZI|nr:Protein BNI4 [Madurella mycetomatis]